MSQGVPGPSRNSPPATFASAPGSGSDGSGRPSENAGVSSVHPAVPQRLGRTTPEGARLLLAQSLPGAVFALARQAKADLPSLCFIIPIVILRIMPEPEVKS